MDYKGTKYVELCGLKQGRMVSLLKTVFLKGWKFVTDKFDSQEVCAITLVRYLLIAVEESPLPLAHLQIHTHFHQVGLSWNRSRRWADGL
jgi:hypothetical protein